MKKPFFFWGLLALMGICCGVMSCNKTAMTGKISLNFSFSFEGSPVVFDEKAYVIASGNAIKIDNIQYFISDFSLVERNGKKHRLTKEHNKVHYVDSDLPATLQWNIDEELPTAVYDYVEFVYGVDSAHNRSGMFADVPESLMFWPESMGGGYHHLKLNGHYAKTAADSVFYPFGFHAGMLGNTLALRDTLRVFITEGNTKTLRLNMEVSHWFKNPNVWDFEKFGASIMQNQEAQCAIKENARDVFSIH